MSWMDSWSRPQKDQAVPAPFYLTHADSAKYCYTCGRIIGSRRSNTAKSSNATVKYCSDRCKRHKPSSQPDSTEKRIEAVILALLSGKSVQPPSTGHQDSGSSEDVVPAPIKAKYQPRKGDPRIIVQLSEVEEAVFGSRFDPEKTFGRKKNRRARGVMDGPEWKSVDMESNSDRGHGDSDTFSDDSEGEMFETQGVKLSIRPPQSQSEVNFSVGGERGWAEKIEETPEMERKRLEGVRRAEEKENVKQAARRAVIFGVAGAFERHSSEHAGQQTPSHGKRNKKKSDDAQRMTDPNHEPTLRKCEALMNGTVVEPSFAKGDWSIRWRDEY